MAQNIQVYAKMADETAAQITGRLDADGNPKSALLSVAANLWRNRCRKLSLRQRITGPVASLEQMREAGGFGAPTAVTSAAAQERSEDAAVKCDTDDDCQDYAETNIKSTARRRVTALPFPGTISGGEPVSGAPGPLDTVIAREEAQTVRQAVARLPDRYRVPVLLFYMEDLKIPEIAAVLHIPQGTVKSRLHKAKKLLAQDLKEVLDET